MGDQTFNFIELTDPDNDYARQAFDLYESSFPAAERSPVAHIKESIRHRLQRQHANRHHSRYYIGEQGEKVVGLSFYGYFGDARLGFLYYLAVQPELRGQGLGAWLFHKTLAQLPHDAASTGGEAPRGLVWEVERPVDGDTPAERDLRQRRINFYRRNGALLLERSDFLAPPMAPDLPPVMYHVMFLPSPGFVEDLASHTFLTDVLDTILLNGYGIERDSPYYRRAVTSW